MQAQLLGFDHQPSGANAPVYQVYENSFSATAAMRSSKLPPKKLLAV